MCVILLLCMNSTIETVRSKISWIVPLSTVATLMVLLRPYILPETILSDIITDALTVSINPLTSDGGFAIPLLFSLLIFSAVPIIILLVVSFILLGLESMIGFLLSFRYTDSEQIESSKETRQKYALTLLIQSPVYLVAIFV